MTNQIYVRLDGDNIGDSIELSLLTDRISDAQRFHNNVQEGIKNVLTSIEINRHCSVLMVGCDDIFFAIKGMNDRIDFLKDLQSSFYIKTGFTLSMGIGLTMKDALLNLKIAKLSGKNKIVDGTISYI